MIRLTVNGQSLELDPGEDASLVDVLRNDLGLTGAKVACDTGACGACTVLVDGVPALGCLMPAVAAAERDVETVEGLGPVLHPVQRALMSLDGLQCGFCTPGFVMQGVSFYRRWRAARGQEAPSGEEIVAAFAGHLCRCGAYTGIIAAIQAACEGRFDGDADPSYPRHDALPKVTGSAQYTVDVALPGQLEGALVRSTHAHARIARVDDAAARALPGVRAFVDLLGPVREVRYVGQEIAAVAAVDGVTARRAADLVDVEYDPLPAVVTAADAREPGAAVVYERGRMPNESELPLPPEPHHDNVRGPLWVFSHRPLRAMEAIAFARMQRPAGFVEGRWRTAPQSHTPLEPHAAVAQWTGAGLLTVHLSTQACAEMAHDIAERFELTEDRVHVIAPFVGGGFGCKSSITPEAVAAIELARLAQAPVRVALERSEEFAVGGYRPGVDMSIAVLGDAEGRIEALEMRAYGDGGVSIGSSVASLCRFPLPKASKLLLDYDVVTHAAPAKPFRGPGGPAACWALESACGELADRLGIDGLSLRRENHGLAHIGGLCDWVATLPAWRDRNQRHTKTGRYRSGIGLSYGAWGYFVEPETQVEVSVDQGALHVSCASQDIGTGTRSVLARAVADVFGISQTAIHVHVGSSKLARGPMSCGSRTTASVQPAARAAAQDLQSRLIERARQVAGLRHARAVPGGITHDDGMVPWAQYLASAPAMTVTAKRPRDHRRYLLPFAFGGFKVGRGIPASLHIVEVELDTWTGQVRVPHVWAGFSVGEIAVKPLALSQAHGGIIQGLGHALYEERVLDPVTGAPLTVSLDDYRLPGIGDTPEIDIHFEPGGFDYVRGRGVGLAELTTIGVGAAVGAAVAHATGWRPTDLPIRPDRVMMALEQGAFS